MKVLIALPCPAGKVSGGLKVLFHYANALAEKHDVTVLHVPYLPPNAGLVQKVKAMLHYGLGVLGLKRWRANWMFVDPRIKLLWRPALSTDVFKGSDVIICSYWHTAYWLRNHLPAVNKVSYLVQEYEYYRSADSTTRAIMEANFSAGFDLLAISPAVEALLQPLADKVQTMPNGVELDRFQLLQPVNSPERKWVVFPARGETFKRTGDAIDAISKLPRERLPYRFACFGAEKPMGLPDYIEFIPRPDNTELQALLNRCAVFITPSLYEGWGLPGAEAMACGAALVSTANGGVDAYAQDQQNALIVPTENVAALSAAVLKLLQDNSLREHLATAGHESIQRFSWHSAAERMGNYLEARYDNQ